MTFTSSSNPSSWILTSSNSELSTTPFPAQPLPESSLSITLALTLPLSAALFFSTNQQYIITHSVSFFSQKYFPLIDFLIMFNGKQLKCHENSPEGKFLLFIFPIIYFFFKTCTYSGDVFKSRSWYRYDPSVDPRGDTP